MNVASITAIATNQGLPPPGAEPLLAGCGVILLLPQVSRQIKHLEMRWQGAGFQCCFGQHHLGVRGSSGKEREANFDYDD
jgi:hypothetical protein